MKIACGKLSRKLGVVIDGILTPEGWDIEILIPPNKHQGKVQVEGWLSWTEIEPQILSKISAMPYRRCCLCGDWDKRRKHVCAKET